MIQESELTDKQLIFAKEYLSTMNATQSAIKAGYSENSAYSQGCRLLKNAKVKTYINESLEERTLKLDITADRLLEELSHIAFFNISSIFNGSSLREVSDLPESVSRAISGIKSRVEKGQDGSNVAEIVEIKANDKIKAIELLMKHKGMFSLDNEQGKSNTNEQIRIILE